MRAMYSPSWGQQLTSMNALPERPTMAVFERNLTSILDFIRQSSPSVKIAVGTLPPMGEDLRSPANTLVREANTVIERVAKNVDHCTVIPIFDGLESHIEKSRSRKYAVPVDLFPILSLIMTPWYHVAHLLSWNTLSMFVGNTVLTDGLHLNERGADIVVDLIIQWLLSANVAKAIAVKS